MKSYHPSRVEALPWRSIDGRAVVLNPRAAEVHELDEVATLLWSRADGSCSLEDLARTVSHEFDVDGETALDDAREFFEALAARGLIRWDRAASP